jgi:hypothetical protein
MMNRYVAPAEAVHGATVFWAAASAPSAATDACRAHLPQPHTALQITLFFFAPESRYFQECLRGNGSDPAAAAVGVPNPFRIAKPLNSTILIIRHGYAARQRRSSSSFQSVQPLGESHRHQNVPAVTFSHYGSRPTCSQPCCIYDTRLLLFTKASRAVRRRPVAELAALHGETTAIAANNAAS